MSLFYLTLLSGIFVGAASGLIGSFLILRKMSLMSDALSHIALPGIALGILLNFTPLLGGIIFLFLGIIFIWFTETKTKLATESIAGVVFVTALALGALLMPEQELLETFFGNVENLNIWQIFAQSLIALGIIIFTLLYLKKITLFSIAPDLAIPFGISNQKTELIMLILIALTISIGISFVGILLMSALIIIPPATSKNITHSFKQFLTGSVILAVVSLCSAIIVNHFYPYVSTGIATVLLNSLFFLLSFIFKNKSFKMLQPKNNL